MKDEYDFSKAPRGRFFRQDAALAPPVHLDPEVLAFLTARAQAREAEDRARALAQQLGQKQEELAATEAGLAAHQDRVDQLARDLEGTVAERNHLDDELAKAQTHAEQAKQAVETASREPFGISFTRLTISMPWPGRPVRRARMPRRVGSARADRVALRRSDGIYLTN